MSAVETPILDARRTWTDTAEPLPAVDAGIMTVVPDESYRIIADRMELERFPPHQRRNEKDLRVGDLPHLIVTALTSCARACPPKPVKAVRRDVSVRPCYRQLLLGILDGDASRCKGLVGGHFEPVELEGVLFTRYPPVPGYLSCILRHTDPPDDIFQAQPYRSTS